MKFDEYNNFEKYKYWLGKYVPENMQKEAMKYFSSCEETMISFILDPKNAANWDNAIKVIDHIGFPKNKKAVGSVMYALKDINWPIAETALKIIAENYENDRSYVIEEMEKIIETADREKDTEWLWGLSSTVELLGIKKENFSSKESWELLLSSGYWD